MDFVRYFHPLNGGLMVIQTSMSGPKKKKDDDEVDDEDWMSEFIGTSQDLDMAAVTDTSGGKEEKSAEPEDDDDEDPFAVNTVEKNSSKEGSS